MRSACWRAWHRQNYFTWLRVEPGTDMTEENQVGISEMAYALGFFSQAYLTTVFGRLVGITCTNALDPARSRKNIKEIEWRKALCYALINK